LIDFIFIPFSFHLGRRVPLPLILSIILPQDPRLLSVFSERPPPRRKRQIPSPERPNQVTTSGHIPDPSSFSRFLPFSLGIDGFSGVWFPPNNLQVLVFYAFLGHFLDIILLLIFPVWLVKDLSKELVDFLSAHTRGALRKDALSPVFFIFLFPLDLLPPLLLAGFPL